MPVRPPGRTKQEVSLFLKFQVNSEIQEKQEKSAALLLTIIKMWN